MKNILIYPINFFTFVIKKFTKVVRQVIADEEMNKSGYRWASDALRKNQCDYELIKSIASRMPKRSPWQAGAMKAIKQYEKEMKI